MNIDEHNEHRNSIIMVLILPSSYRQIFEWLYFQLGKPRKHNCLKPKPRRNYSSNIGYRTCHGTSVYFTYKHVWLFRITIWMVTRHFLSTISERK